MNHSRGPLMARAAILCCAFAWHSADAQLMSAYDGDEPGPRSWVTDVQDGSFVDGPFSRAEALAADEATSRIFASSGSGITTIELVAADDFQGVANATVRLADGTTFRRIRGLAYGDGQLYAYNAASSPTSPAGGVYAVDEFSGLATLLVEQALLPVPPGGLFAGLTFDPASGTLYILVRDSAPGEANQYSIHALDPGSGVSTLVRQFAPDQFEASFDGFAFGGGRFYMTMGNIPRPIGVYNLVTDEVEASLPNPPRFGNGPGGATYAEFLVDFLEGPGEPIPPPSGLNAFNSSAGVYLSWTTIRAGNFAFVTVFRSTSPEGPFAPIAQAGSGSYIDRDTAPGTTYFYFVTVTDTGGRESEPSRVVNVTTPGAAPGADTISVDRINPRTKTNRKGKVQGRGVVFVVDADGQPVSNVVVTGTFSGGYTGTVTALTNARGRAVLKSPNRLPAAASFTVCVEDLERAGFDYDAGANGETCDSL